LSKRKFRAWNNFPNNKAFEREKGRIVRLAPNVKYISEITLAVHLDKE